MKISQATAIHQPRMKRTPQSPARALDRFETSEKRQPALARWGQAISREVGRGVLVGAGYAALAGAGACMGLQGVALAAVAGGLGHGLAGLYGEAPELSLRLALAGSTLGMFTAGMGGIAAATGSGGAVVGLVGIYVTSLALTSSLLKQVLP